MSPVEFEYIRRLLLTRSGLAITQEKIYLLEGRLLPVARSMGHETLETFLRALQARPDETVIAQVVDAMTTNESMFFRDNKPFEQLRDVILPRMKALKRPGTLRIWSAACSTGQEPYSVAMTLEAQRTSMPGFHYEITATDISPRVLEKAAKGVYTQFEVQRGLPIQMLLKHFAQLQDNQWQLSSAVRRMVQFRPFNLLDDFRALGTFDIILCRNVLIYFDEPTKRAILDKLSRCLERTGVLILGSTETVLGISDKYKSLENERGIHVLS